MFQESLSFLAILNLVSRTDLKLSVPIKEETKYDKLIAYHCWLYLINVIQSFLRL